jgi:uncharacterized protein with HEPN domain
VRRDDERLADILEAAEKIAVRCYFEVDLDIPWDVAITDVPSLAARFIRSNPGRSRQNPCGG